MAQIEFVDVSYNNDGKTILNNISVKIDKGDYVSIVGASGSGKSTFLKLCCHLLSPTNGEISLNGNSILDYNPIELRRNIGYCFQTPTLFGKTVNDNLAFPYLIRNKKVDIESIHSLLTIFNMDKDILKNNINNLSGGEKQRIALIRTLLCKPKILLLDEATSALDTDNTQIVESAIQMLNQNGITILWVTHSPTQSRKYANKLLTMQDGQIQSMEVLK